MRVNTAESIRTANIVHAHFGTWDAARRSAQFKDGKFVVTLSPLPQRPEARATPA